MFPLAGPAAYFLFGINRVRTRAREMHAMHLLRLGEVYDPLDDVDEPRPGTDADGLPEKIQTIARVADAVARRPLVEGNRVELLHNGEEAYPAMLDAIASARRRVVLATYIFETNETGRRFIDALADAEARGLEVRVLIDGVGEWYSRPRASALLARRGVPVARFLPPRLVPPAIHVNLRNHRKILVVDGEIAFTGGMNIGDRHLAARVDNPKRVIDTHVRLRGPVAAEIESVFREDWQFVTGETLEPLPRPSPCGDAYCRVLVDGPNEDMDRLAMTLVGIAAIARRRLWIVTPYFLPPAGLTAALQAAAMRGVDVAILLPRNNNLPYMHWATRNMLWELLPRGVRVYYQPGPFVHTKLLVMDDLYVQLGSANIDTRSLRLNFELVVEVYDEDVNGRLAAEVAEMRSQASEVHLEELAGRPFFERARDAVAWLFTPYL